MEKKHKSAMPNGANMLENLAVRHHCFISNLKHNPILRRAVLSDLIRMKEDAYPLDQWQCAVRYLAEDNTLRFANVQEAKQYILSIL